MLNSTLLELTGGHALGSVPYGGAGLWKTLAQHTLPAPILNCDFEEGNVSLIPWQRRRRKWNEKTWTNISQETREKAYALLDPKKLATGIQPGPYIDTIWYDNMVRASYTEFISDLSNFEPEKYNSLSLDSLAEFSFDVQTFSKPEGRELFPIDQALLWAPIQERTAIALRRMRNYRDAGVFIYLTAQEIIDKDYVKDPRGTAKGERPPEAYSIKGTVDIPGKLVNTVQHITDLMFHCRTMNGAPVWVTSPEPIGPGGDANWEAKDRTGRIKEKFVRPNFRTIFKDIYGEEGRDAIYNSAKELLSRG